MSHQLMLMLQRCGGWIKRFKSIILKYLSHLREDRNKFNEIARKAVRKSLNL